MPFGPIPSDSSFASVVVAAVLMVASAVNAAARADSPLVGEMKTIDGAAVDLGSYKGQVVLIVNVASRCGATPQYAGLQKLYEANKDKGFVILGFPANDFGAQEPGTDAEIAQFCSAKYAVTFPMFSKITVTGPAKAPLYKTLTESSGTPGEVAWNFEKFLIGRDGSVIGRFKTRVQPDDPALLAAIEAALAE
jgi:glutathione peroxidase